MRSRIFRLQIAIICLWTLVIVTNSFSWYINRFNREQPSWAVMNEVEKWLIVDQDQVIKNVSQPLAKELGYSPIEMLNEPLTTLIPVDFRERHCKAFVNAIRHRPRTGVIIEVKNAQLLKKDGTHLMCNIQTVLYETSKGIFVRALVITGRTHIIIPYDELSAEEA